LIAETALTNPASARVLEKNGFVVTGTRIDPEDGALRCWRRALVAS
jgi:RimJ/RimL family protein N-acetyltransferase